MDGHIRSTTSVSCFRAALLFSDLLVLLLLKWLLLFQEINVHPRFFHICSFCDLLDNFPFALHLILGHVLLILLSEENISVPITAISDTCFIFIF